MIRLLFLPVRLLFGSVRVGYRAGRTVGASRAIFFGLGFTAGVWIASPTFRRMTLRGAAKGVATLRKDDPPPEVPPVG